MAPTGGSLRQGPPPDSPAAANCPATSTGSAGSTTGCAGRSVNASCASGVVSASTAGPASAAAGPPSGPPLAGPQAVTKIATRNTNDRIGPDTTSVLAGEVGVDGE